MNDIALVQNTSKPLEALTTGIDDIKQLFRSLAKPYGAKEIRRFNCLYGRVYPKLNVSEMRNAECYVDELLENLSDQNLASMVYGVV